MAWRSALGKSLQELRCARVAERPQRIGDASAGAQRARRVAQLHLSPLALLLGPIALPSRPAGFTSIIQPQRARASGEQGGAACGPARRLSDGALRGGASADPMVAHALDGAPSCRDFLLANYAELKKANPHFPILVRESAGVEAKLVGRFGAWGGLGDAGTGSGRVHAPSPWLHSACVACAALAWIAGGHVRRQGDRGLVPGAGLGSSPGPRHRLGSHWRRRNAGKQWDLSAGRRRSAAAR